MISSGWSIPRSMVLSIWWPIHGRRHPPREIALRPAGRRSPARATVTSAGVTMTQLGASDWAGGLPENNSRTAAGWITHAGRIGRLPCRADQLRRFYLVIPTRSARVRRGFTPRRLMPDAKLHVLPWRPQRLASSRPDTVATARLPAIESRECASTSGPRFVELRALAVPPIIRWNLMRECCPAFTTAMHSRASSSWRTTLLTTTFRFVAELIQTRNNELFTSRL